jgi:hypothetical protein
MTLLVELTTQVADIIKDGPGILDFLDDIFATGKQKANAWAKKEWLSKTLMLP